MPLPEVNDVIVERVRFPSGPYLLEGELAYTEETDAPPGSVVLAGSHPLLGGTMHNNVVRGLGDGLAEKGWLTLRFNYRGVENSEGPRFDVARHVAAFWETSHVPGEMDLWNDVQAGVDHVRPIAGRERPLVLIGYSFGCALLPPVCRSEAPAAVVLIAPPLNKHDYKDYSAVQCPLLVVVSNDDFTLDPGRLRAWYDPLPQPKRLVQAALDNHFFRGHEPWLVETITAFLQEYLR